MIAARPQAPARVSPPAPRETSTAALEVRGVRHVYRARAEQVPALDRTSLRVPPGELLAILGPSGCGKTTLLRILAGLLAPTEGDVLLDGQPPAAAHRRRAIGWLAQDDGLFPWKTVADNVVIPLRLQARSGSADLAAEMLARVGLADSADRYPHELSGGMRQRAALARALVHHPSFLLLDEPFAHLDELTRERLGSLLLELWETIRPTTVLVTHSVAEAVRLADRVLVLSDRPGRVLLDLDVALARPRRDDQPGFGVQVQRLKSVLVADR